MKLKKEALFWQFHLLWWLLFMAYSSLPTYKLPEGDTTTIIIFELVHFISLVLVSYGYRHLYKKMNPDENSQSLRVVSPIIGVILLGSIFFILNSDGIFFHYNYHGQVLVLSDRIMYLIDCIWDVSPWFLGFHLFQYARLSYKSKMQLLQAQQTMQRYELDNLRNQLNPHFLFNSLNDIRSLMLTDVHSSRDAMLKLSELLRMTLKLGEHAKIYIHEELELVNNYLSIEKLRFENRLTINFNIDNQAMQNKIPPMSIQLLVENAIKHGVSKLKKGGVVNISIAQDDHTMTIAVENSGQVDQHSIPVSGIGLTNLQKRLKLCFGDNYKFNITAKNSLVMVSMEVPIIH
jgi:sensor histidine kinase YesM